MPTYEYLCSTCGYRFEEFQSIKDDPLSQCPQCNTESLRRLLGAGAGLIFKGSGFYITDYKNNGNGKYRKADTTNKSESATDSEPSSTSKEKSHAESI